jgi:hypothetical protein
MNTVSLFGNDDLEAGQPENYRRDIVSPCSAFHDTSRDAKQQNLPISFVKSSFDVCHKNPCFLPLEIDKNRTADELQCPIALGPNREARRYFVAGSKIKCETPSFSLNSSGFRVSQFAE